MAQIICIHLAVYIYISRLLDVLADRKAKKGLSGHVLINGRRQPHNFKCASAYVVQVCKMYAFQIILTILVYLRDTISLFTIICNSLMFVHSGRLVIGYIVSAGELGFLCCFTSTHVSDNERKI